jgi:hypothetical protein
MNKLVKQQNSVGIQTVNNDIRNVNKTQINIYNANLTNKQFKEYSTKKDLLLMNALITKWAKYTGAKQPEALDLNTIANYIKESFPNFNDFDLNEMIVLLVNGKLETDAEHYGSLSVIYCSKVLHSYQDYKFKALSKVREELQKIENQKPKAIDREERLKNFKLLLTQAQESSKKEYYIDSGDVIYHFINNNKLFPVTTEIKENASKYSLEKINNENKKKALNAVINNLSFKSIEELNFDKDQKKRKFAREYYVNLWLKNVNIQNICNILKYEMIDY